MVARVVRDKPRPMALLALCIYLRNSVRQGSVSWSMSHNPFGLSDHKLRVSNLIMRAPEFSNSLLDRIPGGASDEADERTSKHLHEIYLNVNERLRQRVRTPLGDRCEYHNFEGVEEFKLALRNR